MHQTRSNSFSSTITTTQPDVSSRVRSRSCIGVSWAKKIKVRVIAGIDDYSEQEKSDSFYSSTDYQRIRDEIAEVCFLMKHGSKESDDVSYRGLELKREGEYRRRKLHRWCVNMAVFEENDKQHNDGFYDPEAIGDIYKMLTKQSRVEALERATKDAKDVNQHHGIPSSDAQTVLHMSLERELMTKFPQRANVIAASKNCVTTKSGAGSPGLITFDAGRGMTVLSLVAQQ